MPKREREGGNVKSTKQPNKSQMKASGSKGLTELDEIFSTRPKKEETTENNKEEQLNKQHRRAQSQDYSRRKKSKLTYSRLDLDGVKEKEWADDGLGGKFNKEGYTGRVEGGVKVFKAHLFNKKDFGKSADCPFDCNCCFIWSIVFNTQITNTA